MTKKIFGAKKLTTQEGTKNEAAAAPAANSGGVNATFSDHARQQQPW